MSKEKTDKIVHDTNIKDAIGDNLDNYKPWMHDIESLKVIPNEYCIAIKLPEDEQPKASLIIELPDSAMKSTPVRAKAISVGPGRVLLNGGNAEPKLKPGDIFVFFSTNGIKLTHLGDDVYFVPDMNVIYVEPKVK